MCRERALEKGAVSIDIEANFRLIVRGSTGPPKLRNIVRKLKVTEETWTEQE
ncbi:MAG: hypothetical protein ACJ8H8_34930 [Geminicoccaceae bacterium]